jgi:hypothetical protein
MKFAPLDLTVGDLGLLIIVVTAVAFCMRGWSSVTVTPATDTNDTSDGVHFYEPRPYLLVTKAEGQDVNGKPKSDFVSQIVWLPNPKRRYKVEVKSGWGTVNGSVKLQNGWMLDTLGAQMDSKIPETISAVGGLMTAAIAKGTGQGSAKVVLYLINVEAEGKVSLVMQDEKTL